MSPPNYTDTVIKFLRRIRDPIATYQEQKGISKTENYSFVDLMKSLSHHAYAATMTIFVMLYNLMPLFEGFTYLLRFTLDKLIDIFETAGALERVVKSTVFGCQLLILFILLYFMISILLIPILHFTLIFITNIFHTSV